MKHLLLVLLALAMAATGAHAQVRGEYLITNYGAKGDGAFDNAPIINELIGRISSKGGSIVIPHGDFRIDSSIVLDKNFVTIRGTGRGSKIVMGPAVTEGIYTPDASTRISGIEIRDLCISGTNWSIYQTAISINRANDGVLILNVACTDLHKGIWIKDADAGRIIGCAISRCESSLTISGGGVTVVNRNHFSGFSGGIAVEFLNLNRAQFTGNIISPDASTALSIRNSSHCNISGNTIQTWYTGAIELEGDMNSLSGNTIIAERVNGTWLTDPKNRDGHHGLIRIRGNDNLVTTSNITSGQPEGDIRVNVVSGARNTLRGLLVNGIGSDRKINVSPDAEWTRITHCAWPQETQLNGNSTARVIYDP